jgi:hypothetical protein
MVVAVWLLKAVDGSKINAYLIEKIGVPDRTRTCDPQFRKLPAVVRRN